MSLGAIGGEDVLWFRISFILLTNTVDELIGIHKLAPLCLCQNPGISGIIYLHEAMDDSDGFDDGLLGWRGGVGALEGSA
jgi:hypothetical protein